MRQRFATEPVRLRVDLPEKLHTRLQRIERAVRQATELTQALLLLSRAERSGPVDGETTDVAKVVAEVIDTHRPDIARKRIELRAQSGPEEPKKPKGPQVKLAVIGLGAWRRDLLATLGRLPQAEVAALLCAGGRRGGAHDERGEQSRMEQ